MHYDIIVSWTWNSFIQVRLYAVACESYFGSTWKYPRARGGSALGKSTVMYSMTEVCIARNWAV